MAFHCATATTSPSPSPCLPRRQHRHHHALPHSPPAPPPAPPSAFRHPRHLTTVGSPRTCGAVCGARRRVRHEEDEDEDEEYGHNEEMARLERYSEGARDQALLVKATVDDEVEVVLVFKGFSSSLSGRTAPDPAMSVLPEKAIIQSVDVVKGPFDPSNIEYLEKDLAWDDFKSRLQ